MKIPTQFDVARLAGVSQPTVASVLGEKNANLYSSEIRERVLTASRKLNYQPNRHARAFSTQKSGMVGVVYFGMYQQVHYTRLSRMIDSLCRRKFQPLVEMSLFEMRSMENVVDSLIGMRVEGVILMEAVYAETWKAPLKRLLKTGIPVIQVGGFVNKDIPFFAADVTKGFYDLTTRLIHHGYRKLTLAVREQAPRMPGDRLEGFTKACRDLKVRSSDAKVWQCPAAMIDPADPFEGGMRAVEHIRASGSLPDVLMCSNDSWALAATAECIRSGISIPGDMAITGFDNDVAGKHSPVPLTTYAQPIEAVNEAAVEYLTSVIGGSQKLDKTLNVKFPCELVLRESCGTVKSSEKLFKT